MVDGSRKASTSRRPRSRLPSRSYSPLSVSPSSSVESLLTAQARPRPLKVVIIGPASVGKTTLRQRYFTRRFQRNYKATIGTDFEAKVVECKGTDWGTAADAQKSGLRTAKGKAKATDFVGGIAEDEEIGPSRKILLTVWDTAGQERFRALGSAFYRGADAVVICFDASSESEAQVQHDIQEWYTDFKDKSGLTASQNRPFCWVAVGCKADLRGDGAVARRQVRQMLNRLIARRGGDNADGGLQTGGEGQGDEPPADPKDVLSREGMHEEDDRDLHIDEHVRNGAVNQEQTEGAEAGVIRDPMEKFEIGAKPGEKVSRADLKLGRSPSAECQDEIHGHLQTTKGMIRSRSDATDATVESVNTVRERARAEQEDKHRPFPSSSPPPSSGSLSVPPRTPPPKKSSHLRRPRNERGDSDGTAPVDVRSRYDSNISISSSAHLSVYHTPRNSQMYGTSSSATDNETGSPRGVRKLGQKASLSTLGKDDDPALAPETEKEQTAFRSGLLLEEDSNTRKTEATATPVAADPQKHSTPARRRRSLSTASGQTLAGAKAKVHRQLNGAEAAEGELQTPVRKHLDDLPSPPRPIQGFSLFYTSSLDGTNVQAVFEHIISRCSAKWDWDEYTHRMDELHARRRSRLLAGGAGVRRRRSIWETLRGGWKGVGGSEDEEDRMDEEMRRMVRLSDGKGDDRGGCC
ncbi:P-loop containing nucleoside triphosphate hydrolase protein [Microstroma glucosiphilum]|uniref:P-loop containing nucleoside triphosphate hydrolase protein n=1 Tax=Pseudomicrostroma glucosiphilum TaxID=1684307 RepID=A0A316UGN7_9BASI|nr:P-loop containing nucleoside triphosphate hydrolase protein [Pseudomicrostroma glucosiphilum]PWN22335.1 P-loop containing nucleoside triphosphate hydrolase protein [Pseudomicrostroma glucosiphilum]